MNTTDSSGNNFIAEGRSARAEPQATKSKATNRRRTGQRKRDPNERFMAMLRGEGE